MLDILPPIYPNEIFYSWISRYRSISGNSNKSTVHNLFNRATKTQLTIYYPHYLEYFCSNVSEYFPITPKEVIEKYTITPLFKPFIDDNEYNDIITSFIKEKYISIPKKQMHYSPKHKTQKIYFCKECYKKDYEKNGEYYINRMHQIPGNEICSKHLIKLSEFEIPSNVSKTELVDINNYDLSNEDIRYLIYEEQINLSYDLNDLFKSNLENQNIKLTIDKYDVILDIQVFSEIEQEYKKIISSEKLVRVTKSLIGQRTGYSSLLYSYIDKLPKTSKLLNEICETVEEFQIRRIEFFAKRLYENKGVLKKWEVIRAAGIRKEFELRLNPIIDKIIDEYN